MTPFLWFDDQAEQAAKYYVSIFKKNSKITDVTRVGRKTMFVAFKLNGREYMALNGGKHYELTPAFSLFVSCKTQKEIDLYWKKLSKGGKVLRCGWLTDKFGLTWQIIPEVLPRLLYDKNQEKAGRAMQAMLTMDKLDIAALKKAHAGK